MADALEDVLAHIAAEPTDGEAHLRAGELELEAGDRAAAAAHLTQAERLGVAYAGAWRRLGEAHLSAGEIVAATVALDRAAALSPGDAEVRALCRKAWEARGRPDGPEPPLAIPEERLAVALVTLACEARDPLLEAVAGFVPTWLADALTPDVDAAAVHAGPAGTPLPRPVRRSAVTAGERTEIRRQTGARTLVTGVVAPTELVLEVEAGHGGVRSLARAALGEPGVTEGVCEVLEKALHHFLPKGAKQARADLERIRALTDVAFAELVVLAEGRAADPVSLAVRVLEAAPEIALARALAEETGERHLAAGDAGGARRLAGALEAACPTSAASKRLLAAICRASGDKKGRAAALAEAAGREPASVSPVAIGEAYADAGDPATAAAWYTRAGGDPDPHVAADGLVALGLLHAAAGRHDEARARIHEALRRLPTCGAAHAALGQMLGAAGDRKGMIRELALGVGELALADRQTLVDEASDVLLADGDAKGLYTIAAAAVADGKSTPLLAAAYAVGALRCAPGDLGKAIVHLRRHLDEGPKDVRAQVRSLFADVTVALAHSGPDREHALTNLTRAVEVAPEHGPARVALGEALLETGRTAEALTVLERAPGLPGAGPEAWTALARALVATNQIDKARVAAERGGKSALKVPELARLLGR